MTETEAKTKWCPLSEGKRACIGSGCMMWREYGPPSLADQLAIMQSGMDADAAHAKLTTDYPDGRQGHCGLAGNS